MPPAPVRRRSSRGPKARRSIPPRLSPSPRNPRRPSLSPGHPSGGLLTCSASVVLSAGGGVKSVDIRNGNVRAAELGTIVERTETIAISNGETGGANVQCDPGDQATGGGAEWGTPEEGAGIVQSHRVENGWEVTAEHNAGGGAKQLTVYANCLQA